MGRQMKISAPALNLFGASSVNNKDHGIIFQENLMEDIMEILVPSLLKFKGIFKKLTLI